MGLSPGAQVLDLGCGYGRQGDGAGGRGFHVVGLDLSTPLLVRGGEEAQRRGLTINFVRGDMRELDFDAQFDGAYCLFSTFGYFDDETNKKTVPNVARALKPGGKRDDRDPEPRLRDRGPAHARGGKARAASCSRKSSSTTSRRASR